MQKAKHELPFIMIYNRVIVPEMLMRIDSRCRHKNKNEKNINEETRKTNNEITVVNNEYGIQLEPE